eukprot:11028063-Karenia_brevis.AAC.1
MCIRDSLYPTSEVPKTCFKDAQKGMRKESSSPDVICFSAAISACDKVGQWLRAAPLLNKMRMESLSPD